MNNNTKPFTKVTLEGLAGLRGLGASSILVYMALRIYGGKDSRAWPSQDRIASDLGLAPVTVRKAIKTLKDRGYILELTRKGKTKTYAVQPKRITDPIVSPIQTDPLTDPNVSVDRSDQIKTPIQTDPQIDKEYIKENIHLITKLNSTKADLIIETEEIEELEEPEEGIKYPNLISFEELQMMRDAFNAKKGDSIESTQDELDLLFVKLWERHSVPQGWVSERSPVEDFRKIRSKFGRIQLKKALKDLDHYLADNVKSVKSDKWAGLRWFERLESWITRRDDSWTAKDTTRLSQTIHVTPAEVQNHNHKRRQARIEAEETAARSMSGSRARELWAGFVSAHPERQSRVQAIQDARVFADFALCEEIKADPELADFALIVSTHIDLAALNIIK